MSGTTRPIPISHGHRSQRGSPIGTTTSTDADASPSGMISQSCPVVNGHGATYFARHQPPPRAPMMGSLPEPSFMLGGDDDSMPELVLPPPAQFESGSLSSSRFVASSCPVDISFGRPGSLGQQHSWTPPPRVPDDFDLSKSPALATMMRQANRRRSSIDQRYEDDAFGQSQDAQHVRSFGIVGARRISDPPFQPPPTNSFVSTSHHFFGEDRMHTEIQSQQFAMEQLSLGGSSLSSSSAGAAPSESNLAGLPPRRPERRGSYDGGIFHFEDQ